VSSSPSKRGIWHPACLEALSKIIVIDFYVAKASHIEIEQAITGGNIEHVKSAFVRGTDDIMFRRYVNKSEMEYPGVPLKFPFSHIEAQHDKLFRNNDETHLQIIIHPRGVLKYRAMPIPQDEIECKRTYESIQVAIKSDDQLLQRACALASTFPDGLDITSAQIPANLRCLLLPKLETHLPIGKDSGGRREMYVLVKAEEMAAEGQPSAYFRRKIIEGSLMENSSVRGIFVIDSKPNRFQYLLQLKCTTFEADEIIWKMHESAHDFRVTFGTRTYDLWRLIQRQSIDGIWRTHATPAAHQFKVALQKRAGSTKDILWPTLRHCDQIAMAWEAARASLMAQEPQALDTVDRFYQYLTLYNFMPTSKPEYLEACRAAFADLAAKYLEEGGRRLLCAILSLPGNADNTEIGRAVEQRIPNQISQNPKWEETIRRYPLRILSAYYRDLGGSNDLPILRANLQGISALRNKATAHSDPQDFFVNAIDLSGADWATKIKDIDSKVCAAIAEIGAERKLVG
jgi:hypothetical protein